MKRLSKYKHPRILKYFLFSLVVCTGLISGYEAAMYFHNKHQSHLAQEAVEDLSYHLAGTSLVPTIDAVIALVKHDVIIATAANKLPEDNTEALEILRLTQFLLDASIVYLLDKNGVTVACTPYGENNEMTLTGKDYSFRPYYRDAMTKADQVTYPALGVTTGKRGIYISKQINDGNGIVGVLVIKMSTDSIDKAMLGMKYPSALYSPDGIIFSSNKLEWLYKTVLPIDQSRLKELHETRQFANEPLSPLEFSLNNCLVRKNGIQYFCATTETHMSEWKALVVKPESTDNHTILLLCGLAGGCIFSVFFIAVTSIVDRRRTRFLLDEQSQRLELALEGGKLGTWDWDVTSDYVMFDRRWAEMKGYTLDEIEPKIDSWKNRVHPDDLPSVYEKVQAHLDGKTDDYEATFRMLTKDGGWIWILDRGRVVDRDSDNKPLRACGTHLDITKQKMLEQEIRKEHQKIFSILDSAPVGVVIVDKKRVIRWINNFVLKFSELNTKELILGKQCGDYLCPAEQNACPVLDFGHDIDSSERIFRNYHGKELPILKTVKEFEFEGEPCFLEIFVDITEQKKLETELLHAQKLESVGRLAAGIAHEINTPIQYIGTNVEFISEGFEDLIQVLEEIPGVIEENCSKEVRQKLEQLYKQNDVDYLREEFPEAIDQTKKGVSSISSIVLAMKRFSHPGSKEKAPVNLNEVVETALAVSRGEWKTVAEIDLELDPELGDVPLIEDEIGQVILNILINATHAIITMNEAKDSTEKGTIRIKTEKKDDFAALTIEDNGCGIAEEYLQKIFEPFFTTKEVGKGTGQGLAICHDVIKNKHQGYIDVESQLGQGTIFTVCLPAV